MRCAAGVAPESSGEVVSGQQVTYSTAPYFSAASAQSVSMDDSGRARTDYGFGFSAGGLLFPYFLGISEQLQSMNVLLPETPVAGASAGSIIAVCAKSGLSEEELLVAFLDLARDCRQGGTRTRLKSVLRRVLEKALPDDIHERCNGRAHLAVTRLWPEFTPQTISSFRSRTDVIDTLLTSSHIPYWFDGSLFTMYRSGVYFDGGITNFIPSTPTDVCYRISCFPSQQLKAFKGISLSPDTFEQWPYDMGTMLGWAFEPAPEDMLLKLVEKGKRDARSWALVNVPVEQLQLAGGGR
ncbi:hypothetical protein CHLRE_12g530950v5 [Chlamydomonas reinhardtii]|uniref:Patatin n=1 Tax=Chlamydomonas reinhardtii TaxID=3055 RepID=A0A2K3D4U4_CHLRE|nr:uncharacterized protein CHLRE_12g530950v5 [Chlamydomonas reinhardtii]PNW75545.1 hypothetical protein CHLRE_12g530950v5 [Chlamydomonas reinhardtii]